MARRLSVWVFSSAMKARIPASLEKSANSADGAQIAQCLHAGAFAAVGEDDAMAVFEQTLRAMQTDTLAGAGDQDRGGGSGHGRLASRWEQKLYQRRA